MKIVIPTDDKKGLDGKVADHFGRCLTYTFIDEEGRLLEIIDNTSQHMGGKGLPPELMKKNGANVLLCKDLGPRALSLCQKLAIKVYVCSVKTVREVFKMWKNDKIKEAGSNSTCDEHKL